MRRYYFSRQSVVARRKTILIRLAFALFISAIVFSLTWSLCSKKFESQLVHKISSEKNHILGNGNTAIVFEPQTSSVARFTDFEGTLLTETKTVASDISSRVTKVYVKQGKTVKKGEAIFQFATGVKIGSPIAGTISKLNVNQGSIVDEKSELFTIKSSSSVISLQIPTEYYNTVDKKTNIVLDAKGQNVKTTISEKLSPVDSTFEVRIALPKNFKAKEKVSASLRLSDAALQYVPYSAILHNGSHYYIKVMENNTVTSVKVDIVNTDQNGAWVSGVDGDKKIIAFGGQYFKDGHSPKFIVTSEVLKK